MKYITIFLMALVMYSCKDTIKVEPETRDNDNFVLAKRNNIDWHGQIEIRFDTHSDSLIILGIVNNPDTQVLFMKIKFEGNGTYELKNSQTHFYSTVGGDVVVSRYELRAGDTGQLIISNYDPQRKDLEGSFRMSLQKRMSNPENNIAAWHFTDGKFKGIIAN